MSKFYETRARHDGLQRRRDGLETELEQVRARISAGGDASGGLEERSTNLRRAIDKANEEIVDADEEMRSELGRMAHDPRHTEMGAVFDVPGTPSRMEARDDGMHTLERFYESGDLTRHAAERLEAVIESPNDPHGLAGQYLSAVGDPSYASAFGKILASPQTAHLKMDAAEIAAVQRVGQVETLRALAEGTGSSGGFAIPIQIDPTIVMSSDGALNPVRQIARIEQTISLEWRGVSSDGVVASYDAEAAETSDDTPTLAQPIVKCGRGTAFVPFSMELEQDWRTLQQELTRLISDARDVLDSSKFATGTSTTTNEPEGVLVGATVTVTSATTAVFALGDVWTLREALPARFIASSSILGHPTQFDRIYRFTGGNSAEPLLMVTRDGPCVGRPAYEWSSMSSATSSAAKVLVIGDFKQYLIADRIGMQIEIVPTLFGSNRLPTGQRGLFAIWRTGAKVLTSNAFRVLVIR
jgi:HK97 family phage major capsid protein